MKPNTQSDHIAEQTDSHSNERDVDVDGNNVTLSSRRAENRYAGVFPNSLDPTTLISLLAHAKYTEDVNNGPQISQIMSPENMFGEDDPDLWLDPTLRNSLDVAPGTSNNSTTTRLRAGQNGRDSYKDFHLASPPSPPSSSEGDIPGSPITFKTLTAAIDRGEHRAFSDIPSARPLSPPSLDGSVCSIPGSPIISKILASIGSSGSSPEQEPEYPLAAQIMKLPLVTTSPQEGITWDSSNMDIPLCLPSPPSYVMDITPDAEDFEAFSNFQYQNPPYPPSDMDVDIEASPPQITRSIQNNVSALESTDHVGQNSIPDLTSSASNHPSASNHRTKPAYQPKKQDASIPQAPKNKKPGGPKKPNRGNEAKKIQDMDTRSQSSCSANESEDEDQSESDTPKRSRRRSPRTIFLQRLVRQHVRNVTNRRTRSAPYPPPPSPDVIDAHLDGGPGPSLNNLEYQYNSSIRHPWNEEAIELVLHDLMEARALTDYKTSEVRTALEVHFRSISRKYRAFIQETTRKTQEEVRIYRSTCSRRQRRTRVYHRRENLCKGFPELRDDLDLLEKLGIGGMSSDESDHTPGHHHRPNPIHRLPWRSSSVTPWLRIMDTAHEALKEERPGHQPHARIDSRIQSMRKRAPKGLPRNFYDPRWLSKQKPLSLYKLNILEENFDFAKLQTYLQ